MAATMATPAHRAEGSSKSFPTMLQQDQITRKILTNCQNNSAQATVTPVAKTKRAIHAAKTLVRI